MDTVGLVALIAIGTLLVVVLPGALIVSSVAVPPLSPADLLTDFEVSRAVGTSVAARRPGRAAVYHPMTGGGRLVQVHVLVGLAAWTAMRRRRRGGRPLAVGDEAYAGDGWVAGRRGAVVVVIEQHDRPRWTVAGRLPWLLATALDRVPTPGADAYRWRV